MSTDSLDDRRPGDLLPVECFWRDHQVWLEGCGYMLRDRYKPGWIPSWRKGEEVDDTDWMNAFDGRPSARPVLDAVRIRDNTDVALKLLKKSTHVKEVDGEVVGEFVELEIGLFFSSDPLAKDPRNHCVPILEVIQVPDDDDSTIIVMPFLRPYSDPRFDTFGEAIDCFGQIFEGLKFMHDHNVAHRDCTHNNIMMDPATMFPDGYHPTKIKRKRDWSGKAKFYTRTQRPPKYYLTDFGISRKYTTRDPPPLERPIEGGGGNGLVPEFETGEPCDPFPTDVFYLGNMIRMRWLEGRKPSEKLLGFEFMRSLVNDMVAQDPAQRPTMDEVVVRFAAIRSSLSWWKLRSRIAKQSDFPLFRSFNHWFRRIGYILRRTPAIPCYRDSLP
ncbi:kinase-like domain-containing protein [Mycena epipterygia]|nr:kinase-like domain-containing protein [Mycena epipterygia]